eukprot:COSAG02_NODE_1485_length_12370_cov_6.022144_8_plen_78_part_00
MLVLPTAARSFPCNGLPNVGTSASVGDTGHKALCPVSSNSVFIAHQVWTGIPPKVRKLASHIILYPQRIAKESVGIA